MFDSAEAALDNVNLPVPHEDGSFISQRVSRLVEMIREYDRNLDVRWIPARRRRDGDPAFAIVGRQQDGQEYVVFYVQDESEFDGRVLERLYQVDAEKQGNILNALDARNKAVRAIQEKLHTEQMEEAKELAYSILRSKLHTYKHDGVTYTD